MGKELIENAQNIETLVVTVPMIFGFLAGTFGIGVIVWGAIQWINKRTIEQQNAPIVNSLIEIAGKMNTHDETLTGVVGTMERIEKSLSDKIQGVDENNKTLFELHQKSTTDNFASLNQAIGQTNKQAERQLTFVREVNARVTETEKRTSKTEKEVAVIKEKIKNGSKE